MTLPTALPPETAAALAAHRFGLGEPRLDAIGNDAPGWLLAQIGPAEAQRGSGLTTGVEGLKRYAEFLQAQRRQGRAETVRAAQAARMDGSMADEAGGAVRAGAVPAGVEQAFIEHFRAGVQADVRARLTTAALSPRPFNERLALFWANHFTVSLAKASTRGIVGAYEREAIRPFIGGRFEDLLKAAVHHAGMLRYLDNDRSAGPDSPLVRRRALRRGGEEGNGGAPRINGLNENLAREILELHTLGVSGGYSQADVTAFAAVLTGWRIAGVEGARFDPVWHQPGEKTVLGRRYAAGEGALDQVLADLARHPSTARFVCTKLARHFVADEPPPSLVARMAEAWQRSEGDLPTVYRALVLAPEAWTPQLGKLKSPEDFVISTVRVLQLGEAAFQRQADGGTGALGQRVQGAPSPAGWPDRAEEWLGPDAVWKRVEWATRVADRAGRRIDARTLARASLGPLLRPETTLQLERAADGPQALALLLLAPEFQRR